MARRDIGTPVVIGYLLGFWSLVGLLGVYATTNEAPGAPVLKWKDDPAFTTTKLDIQIATEAVDPDGDAVSYAFVWKKNGEVQADKASRTIPAKEVRVGETWEVIVTPDDGTMGGSMCGLPWRDCAGATSASLSITIQNSPPTPRVKFVRPDGTEVLEDDGTGDVQLQLSCMDPDLIDADRDSVVAAKAAGEAADAAAKVDPCTYKIQWWPADKVPAEGEVSEVVATLLDAKTRKASTVGWKVVVVANDGEIDGLPQEAVLPLKGKE